MSQRPGDAAAWASALAALVDAARRSGLRSLRSTVLSTDAPMLLLLHRCGFGIASVESAAAARFVTMTRDFSVAVHDKWASHSRRMGRLAVGENAVQT